MKSGASPSDADPTLCDSEAKKIERMLRNRDSAKRSRDHKKKYVNALEKHLVLLHHHSMNLAHRLAMVEAENARLRNGESGRRPYSLTMTQNDTERGGEPAALLSLQWMPLLICLSSVREVLPPKCYLRGPTILSTTNSYSLGQSIRRLVMPQCPPRSSSAPRKLQRRRRRNGVWEASSLSKRSRTRLHKKRATRKPRRSTLTIP